MLSNCLSLLNFYCSKLNLNVSIQKINFIIQNHSISTQKLNFGIKKLSLFAQKFNLCTRPNNVCVLHTIYKPININTL